MTDYRDNYTNQIMVQSGNYVDLNRQDLKQVVTNAVEMKQGLMKVYGKEVKDALAKDPHNKVLGSFHQTLINGQNLQDVMGNYHRAINNQPDRCQRQFVNDHLFAKENAWSLNTCRSMEECAELNGCIQMSSRYWNQMGLKCCKFAGMDDIKTHEYSNCERL